jgi:hypothetical protein
LSPAGSSSSKELPGAGDTEASVVPLGGTGDGGIHHEGAVLGATPNKLKSSLLIPVIRQTYLWRRVSGGEGGTTGAWASLQEHPILSRVEQS